MSNYIQMAEKLREATKNTKASDSFIRALEEHEMKRAEEQARREREFVAMVDRRLSLISDEMAFLRRTIVWSTAFLGLAMVTLSIVVSIYGGG